MQYVLNILMAFIQAISLDDTVSGKILEVLARCLNILEDIGKMFENL